MKRDYTISIDAPVDKAFDSVDSKEKISRWMGGEMQTKFLNQWDPTNPVGTKFSHTIQRIITLEGEVIAYEKPRILGVSQEYKGIRGTFFYYFKPGENNTTILTCELEIADGQPLQKVFIQSLIPLFDQLVNMQIRSLKTIAEETKNS